MTATPDLLPCPFCGGPAEIWRAHEDRPAWIACMGKCSVLVSNAYKTTEEAITAWNTRATGWRDISSAPRDGTPVLAGRFVEGDKFDGYMAVDRWVDRFNGFAHFNNTYWPPTHWMPLPTPPGETP